MFSKTTVKRLPSLFKPNMICCIVVLEVTTAPSRLHIYGSIGIAVGP
jgi:hypothetical protein